MSVNLNISSPPRGGLEGGWGRLGSARQIRRYVRTNCNERYVTTCLTRNRLCGMYCVADRFRVSSSAVNIHLVIISSTLSAWKTNWSSRWMEDSTASRHGMKGTAKKKLRRLGCG